MLNQQIKVLESELSVSESESDQHIFGLLAKIDALDAENGRRMRAAKIRFYAESEEAQYQGELNAAQTAPFNNFEHYGKYGELFYSCEFWEMAAASAESWQIDFDDGLWAK